MKFFHRKTKILRKLSKKENEDLEETFQGLGEVSQGDGLTNTEIDSIMGKYPNYMGCIPHDKVGSLISKMRGVSPTCFVINTDPSSKEGEHWQCVYMDKKEINFYDSFGDPIDNGLMNDIIKLDKEFPGDGYRKFKFNTYNQVQDNRSDNCGHFCCKFLIDRLRGKSFKVASGFNSLKRDVSEKGEKDIEIFKKQQGFGYMMDDLVGTGIIHKIGRFLHLSGRMPLSVRRVLKNKGNLNIKKMVVYRHPVSNGVQLLMNIGSLGKIKQKARELGYDDIYHLYAIMELSDGSIYRFEKTSVAVLQPVSSYSKDNSEDVELGNVSLNEFWTRGENRMGEEKFYAYHATDNNCQDWMSNILRANSMMTSDLNKFINQDVYALMKNQGLLSKISEVATDLGGLAESVKEKVKEVVAPAKNEEEVKPVNEEEEEESGRGHDIVVRRKIKKRVVSI